MSNLQSEEQLEKQLIKALQEMHYQYIKINDISEIQDLAVKEIFKLNDLDFNDAFSTLFQSQIVEALNTSGVYAKARLLRDGLQLKDDSGKHYKTIKFIDDKDYTNNTFYVTNQIENKVNRSNRYDVTLLINGLPLVQIELKRRGGSVEEALNQINRYKKDSMSGTIFEFVQLFVASDQINTFYISNQESTLQKTFKMTFVNKKSEQINQLLPMGDVKNNFTESVLNHKYLINLLTKYTILVDNRDDHLHGTIKMLRPYQINAIEAILKKVNEYDQHKSLQENSGYIFHTTGSGKTITSFVSAKLCSYAPGVKKVIFIVDRNDLENQTYKEYSQMSDAYINVAQPSNSTQLIKYLNDSNINIIVTTIQKLHIVVDKFARKKAKDTLDLAHNRVCMIFDEAHRSASGEQASNIFKYFNKLQVFAFTGTPKYLENSTDTTGTDITENIFGEELGRYTIGNAIKDNSVLPFNIDYHTTQQLNPDDPEFKQIYNSDKFKREVVNTIIETIDRKTDNRRFTAMLATGGQRRALEYYDLIKEAEATYKESHANYQPLKIAVVISKQDNNETENLELSNTQMYAKVIKDFEQLMNTKTYNKVYDLKTSMGEKEYNQDVARLYRKTDPSKENNIDLLIVSDMFLTGYDSPCLNTLYTDKNLKYHNLIQAFSRTNRKALGKDYGNIVSFLYNKEKVDSALALFAAGGSYVEQRDYRDILDEINKYLAEVKLNYANIDDIINSDNLDYQAEFLEKYRKVLHLLRIIKRYDDFTYDDLEMDAQSIEDYRSAYKRINNDLERLRQSVENIDDVPEFDGELELLANDFISYEYIQKLADEFAKERKQNNVDNTKAFEQELRNMENLSNEQIAKFMKYYEYINTHEGVSIKEYLNICLEEDLHKISEQYEISMDILDQIVHHHNVNTPEEQIRDYLKETRQMGLLARRKMAKDISNAIYRAVEANNIL